MAQEYNEETVKNFFRKFFSEEVLKLYTYYEMYMDLLYTVPGMKKQLDPRDLYIWNNISSDFGSPGYLVFETEE